MPSPVQQVQPELLIFLACYVKHMLWPFTYKGNSRCDHILLFIIHACYDINLLHALPW